MLVNNMLADKPACPPAWSHSSCLYKLTGQRLAVHDLHAGSYTQFVAGPAHPFNKDGLAAGMRNHRAGHVEVSHAFPCCELIYFVFNTIVRCHCAVFLRVTCCDRCNK